MRLALTLVMILGCAVPALPAPPAETEDPRLAAMAELPPLVGRWEGSGWIRMGPGEPSRSVGEEVVESRLGGRVLVVEGKHYSEDRSRVVHHALATLTWDEAAKEYRFDTFLVAGAGGTHSARMEDGALIWEIEHPERPTRFIIRVEDDVWKEIGEIRWQGTWRQFFAMDLKRVK